MAGTPVNVTRNYGPQLTGTLKRLKNSWKFQGNLITQGSSEPGEAREYSFELDAAPDYLIELDKGFKNVDVGVSADLDKISFVVPASPGSFNIRFDYFMSRRNEPPAPRWVESKTVPTQAGGMFTIPAHNEYTPVYEVISGPYKGLGFRHRWSLHYPFAQYRDTDITTIEASQRNLAPTIDFLDVFGFDYDAVQIPWNSEGNVLPFLQDTLRDLGKGAIVVLKNTDKHRGLVDSLAPAPER